MLAGPTGRTTLPTGNLHSSSELRVPSGRNSPRDAQRRSPPQATSQRLTLSFPRSWQSTLATHSQFFKCRAFIEHRVLFGDFASQVTPCDELSQFFVMTGRVAPTRTPGCTDENAGLHRRERWVASTRAPGCTDEPHPLVQPAHTQRSAASRLASDKPVAFCKWHSMSSARSGQLTICAQRLFRRQVATGARSAWSAVLSRGSAQ